jgi:hypothetical protein
MGWLVCVGGALPRSIAVTLTTGAILLTEPPRKSGKDWIAFDGNLDLTPLVHAIIKGIRAASPAMTQAGANTIRGIRTTSAIQASAVWQAMIDASLN